MRSAPLTWCSWCGHTCRPFASAGSLSALASASRTTFSEKSISVLTHESRLAAPVVMSGKLESRHGVLQFVGECVELTRRSGGLLRALCRELGDAQYALHIRFDVFRGL